jgi:hypothetical protein
MADRVLRGALAYKTLLIWPYAVAPAIAGVLWAFLFAPSIGIVTYVLKKWGIDWNWIINDDQAMLLIVIAATWKQISYNFLFFLAGCSRSRARCSRPRRSTARRRSGASGPCVPAALADHVLPARDQHRVRLLRHVRRGRRDDAGRARGLRRRSSSTRSTTTA